MTDLIVSNQVEFDQSQHPGNVVNYIEFIQMASGPGLNIDGNLYLNVHDIDEGIYGQLRGSGAKYFRTGGAPMPSWFMESAEDWTVGSTVGTFNTTSPTSGGSQLDGGLASAVSSMFDAAADANLDSPGGSQEAKVYVFGSSKGGVGKTFTGLLSAYRYGRTHPEERIAFVDFDIVDGQVSLAIHKLQPNLRKFIDMWNSGQRTFNDLKGCSVRNSHFPQNVDFYLAPSSGYVFQNNDFWADLIELLVANYDVVIFDTGIDYLNLVPIIMVYKTADKILLVTSTTIKSVASVLKQINKLTGEYATHSYSAEDELGPRINIVITGMRRDSAVNSMVFEKLSAAAPVVATFGQIDALVEAAEYVGNWAAFDSKSEINATLDNIMA